MKNVAQYIQKMIPKNHISIKTLNEQQKSSNNLSVGKLASKHTDSQNYTYFY